MTAIFRQLKLSQMLIISLLIVGILPALIVGLIATFMVKDNLEQQTYNQLNTVRAIKSK